LPAGAWLVHRPKDEPQRIRVSECHHRQPARIVAVRIYDVKNGKHVRDE
jgi:hypothetical protein